MVPQVFEVEKDRYVPIDKELVKLVEIVYPPERVDAYALRAAYQMCTARTEQANGQLKAISEIEPD